MSWPWSELGLDGPAGLPEIRRAYAQRLKTTHPEDDPEGFQRLHSAYQEASRYARRSARTKPPPPEGPGTAEPDIPAPGGESQAGNERPEDPPPPAPEPDWNYEELLEEEPPKPPEPEGPAQDWDYERLFAEGEAEAEEARYRKLEELRRKNRARYAGQERDQRRRAADEAESWSAVMAASHALELLHSSGAPLRQWRRFLSDPVFWNVRANLDFIFLLEDFLEQHPDLSPDVRRAIFAAYGFEKGPGYPIYKPLYRLLNVDRREKRRMAKAASHWRAVWKSYPAWRKAVIAVCFSILAGFFLLGWAVNLRSAYRDYTARREAKAWETQSLQWLEEDLGRPFFHPLSQHKELCAPADEPSLYFWVRKEGQRTETFPGYQTNYPYILLKQELESFAEEWSLGLRFDSAGTGYQGNMGEAPGAYLFDLPLLGAGEAITALGELLKDVESRDWYRVLIGKYGGQMTYQIFLCHGELSFYDAVSTEDGGFDADYARTQYENDVGAAFCRYLLEESGLADKHMGADAYVLLNEGTLELSGTTFFHVTGADKESREPLAQYLMASGGGMLFCLPEGRLDGVRHVTDLYRGTPTHQELDGVGLVMIWDQITSD